MREEIAALTIDSDGPGPEERGLRNRVIFWLTGRWPQAVVAERLLAADIEDRRVPGHVRDGLRQRGLLPPAWYLGPLEDADYDDPSGGVAER